MKRITMNRATVWAATIGLLAPLTVLAVATESDAVPTGCVDVPGPTVVCLYGPGLTNFDVPLGVSSVTIAAFGAAGGDGGSTMGGAPAGIGGRGALVRQTTNVSPGDTLSLRVGAAGQDASGATPGAGGVLTAGAGSGGGGAPGTGVGTTGGGGGGGASSVQLNGAYVLVAGGGGAAGGGGGVYTGGAGGDATAPASGPGGTGQPMNTPAGGLSVIGVLGTPITGQNAANINANGFGGGGGGGGNPQGLAGTSSASLANSAGGGSAGGSGGGAGATFALNPNANGLVQLTYTPCVVPTVVTLDNAVVREGQAGTSFLDFPITLSNPNTCGDTVVKLQAGGGPAINGIDYTIPVANYTVTIPMNMTVGFFRVLVAGDTLLEQDEFLFARIVSVDAGDEPGPPPFFSGQPRIGVIRNDDGVILDCVAGQPLPAGYNPIVGSNRDDRIAGSTGDDIIFGLGGNDKIVGNGGDDILCGGPGRDVLLGGFGNDQLSGDGGNDILIGGDGDDQLVGGPGTDRVLGGPGVNITMP